MKKRLAESLLENEVSREALRKKVVTAPARRELVRWIQARGLTDRRCPAIAGMNASSLRCRPRPDRNAALRACIVALAHRRGVALRLIEPGKPNQNAYV